MRHIFSLFLSTCFETYFLKLFYFYHFFFSLFSLSLTFSLFPLPPSQFLSPTLSISFSLLHSLSLCLHVCLSVCLFIYLSIYLILSPTALEPTTENKIYTSLTPKSHFSLAFFLNFFLQCSTYNTNCNIRIMSASNFS